MSGSFPLTLILTVSLWAGGAPAPTQRTPAPFSPGDADRFATKLATIVARGGATPAAGEAGARRTVLDQVRTSRERGWLDPMRLLGGKVPVSATGVLRTSDGVGRLELESARVGSVPVPLTLLQELVTFYSRSAADPDGISLDEPFALPAGIRRIDVVTGQAVVVQ